MEKRIVLIGDTKSFMVSSIVKELNEKGFEIIQSPCDLDELNKIENRPSVFLLYIDELAEMKDILVYLKDSIIEGNISLSIIGSKNDIEQIEENIPNTSIAATFIRPVNVKEMAIKMEKVVLAEDERLQKKKILVVDDDGTMLRTIKGWLQKDYQVFMVNSGMSAITFLAKNSVDLILLDYEMPVTTGPKVLEMLRSDKSTEDIPVMFLTNKNDKDSVMNVVELKPEKYLLKTMKPMDLLEQINDYFEKKKAKNY